MEDMLDVVDACSLADTWEFCGLTGHEDIDEDAFFVRDGIDRVMESVRSSSMASFHTPARLDDEVLRVQPLSLPNALRRTMDVTTDDARRSNRRNELADVKSKLDLPVVVKGPPHSMDTRFSVDYLPMLAEIIQQNGPQQESRRRSSRRNHYLRDMLSDMALLDEIPRLQTFAAAGARQRRWRQR
ncbi:hypothetical protein PINS_up014658 [Pythium insidiosum]|nr:hypothetical protein PINS_up014658 [Pythium insidiosum]